MQERPSAGDVLYPALVTAITGASAALYWFTRQHQGWAVELELMVVSTIPLLGLWTTIGFGILWCVAKMRSSKTNRGVDMVVLFLLGWALGALPWIVPDEMNQALLWVIVPLWIVPVPWTFVALAMAFELRAFRRAQRQHDALGDFTELTPQAPGPHGLRKRDAQ